MLIESYFHAQAQMLGAGAATATTADELDVDLLGLEPDPQFESDPEEPSIERAPVYERVLKRHNPALLGDSSDQSYSAGFLQVLKARLLGDPLKGASQGLSNQEAAELGNLKGNETLARIFHGPDSIFARLSFGHGYLVSSVLESANGLIKIKKYTGSRNSHEAGIEAAKKALEESGDPRQEVVIKKNEAARTTVKQFSLEKWALLPLPITIGLGEALQNPDFINWVVTHMPALSFVGNDGVSAGVSLACISASAVLAASARVFQFNGYTFGSMRGVGPAVKDALHKELTTKTEKAVSALKERADMQVSSSYMALVDNFGPPFLKVVVPLLRTLDRLAAEENKALIDKKDRDEHLANLHMLCDIIDTLERIAQQFEQDGDVLAGREATLEALDQIEHKIRKIIPNLTPAQQIMLETVNEAQEQIEAAETDVFPEIGRVFKKRIDAIRTKMDSITAQLQDRLRVLDKESLHLASLDRKSLRELGGKRVREAYLRAIAAEKQELIEQAQAQMIKQTTLITLMTRYFSDKRDHLTTGPEPARLSLVKNWDLLDPEWEVDTDAFIAEFVAQTQASGQSLSGDLDLGEIAFATGQSSEAVSKSSLAAAALIAGGFMTVTTVIHTVSGHDLSSMTDIMASIDPEAVSKIYGAFRGGHYMPSEVKLGLGLVAIVGPLYTMRATVRKVRKDIRRNGGWRKLTRDDVSYYGVTLFGSGMAGASIVAMVDPILRSFAILTNAIFGAGANSVALNMEQKRRRRKARAAAAKGGESGTYVAGVMSVLRPVEE